MKKITKKQSESFNKKVTGVILKNGFMEADESLPYQFVKDTNFGVVRIALDSQQGSEIYSIFSRFDNVEKALTIFNCNKFTGKYNFHVSDAQECLSMFEFFLYELENFGK